MLLAASLLLALAAAAPSSTEGSGARVEVLEGHGLLAGRGVVVRMQGGDPERWIDGPAYFQLGVGSRARVTWSGRASLLLEGRSVLEWRPGAEGATPEWELVEVGALHLELRRGPLDVSLAQGWGARLQSGACALRGLPGDGVELDHQAGLPLDLWPPPAGGEPSVPFTVLAGARLRLVPGTPRPLALTGSATSLRDAHQRLGFERARSGPSFPAWRGFAWPWASSVPRRPIEAAVAETPAPELPDLPDALAPVQVPEASPEQDAPALPVEVAPVERVPVGEAETAEDEIIEDEVVEDAPPAKLPELRRARPLRETGVLVLTPYGPRWVDASRAVDPALRGGR